MSTIVAFVDHTSHHASASLVYHLAWIYADLGVRVLAADMSPEPHVTSTFLDKEGLANLWLRDGGAAAIDTAILAAIRDGDGARHPITSPVARSLALLPGSPALAALERFLLEPIPAQPDAERLGMALTAPARVLRRAAAANGADVVLLDLGHARGSMGGAGLLAADHVVVSLATDAYSLTSLGGSGPDEWTWRAFWTMRRPSNFHFEFGEARPAGYVVSVTADNTHDIMSRIPAAYAPHVAASMTQPIDDPECLGLLHGYPSLAPMAREARKPMFHLTAADGALGSHLGAVKHARNAYERLAERVAAATWRKPATTEPTP